LFAGGRNLKQEWEEFVDMGCVDISFERLWN